MTTPAHTTQMAREMAESPKRLAQLITAFLQTDGAHHYVEPDLIDRLASLDEIFLTGCGSSYHALLLAKFSLAEYAGVPARTELAHELTLLGPTALKQTGLVVLASQSGESYDTLRAMDVADAAGCPTLVLVADENSTMAKRARFVWVTGAGIEKSVPSTKGFLAQALLGALLGPTTAKARKLRLASDDAASLHELPSRITATLAHSRLLADAIEAVADARHTVLLGQGAGAGIACEGALKFKETAYLSAQAYAAAEFRHGSIAMLDTTCVVLVLVHRPEEVPLARTLLRAMSASGAKRILLRPQAPFAQALDDEAHLTVALASVGKLLAPLITSIALQQLALGCALRLGRPVDAPRYLVKTVPAP